MNAGLKEAAASNVMKALDERLYSCEYRELLLSVKKALKDGRAEIILENTEHILLNHLNACFRNGAPDGLLAEVLAALCERTEDIFQKNRILNRLEYVTKRTVLSSYPLDLLAVLTDKCNLDCGMCFKKSGWEIPERTADEIIGLMPYLEQVEWMGGEAFLSGQFKRLFEAAAHHPRLKQDVTTNGLLLDDAWIGRFLGTRTEIRISLESVRKDAYERIRRGARFEQLVENLSHISELRKGGLDYPRKNPFDRTPLALNFIVMRSNYKELLDVVEFAAKYGAGRINFLRLNDNEGNATFEEEYIEKDPGITAYLKRAFVEVRKKCEQYGIGCLINLPFLDPLRQGAAEKFKPCMIPWLGMDILRDNVKPFCFCQKNIGELSTGSLKDIWNGEKMRLYRSSISGNEPAGLCAEDCFYGKARSESLFIE